MIKDIEEIRNETLNRWDSLRKKIYNIDIILNDQEKKDFANFTGLCPNCYKEWPLSSLEDSLWCNYCDFVLEMEDYTSFTEEIHSKKYKIKFCKNLNK